MEGVTGGPLFRRHGYSRKHGAWARERSRIHSSRGSRWLISATPWAQASESHGKGRLQSPKIAKKRVKNTKVSCERKKNWGKFNWASSWEGKIIYACWLGQKDHRTNRDLDLNPRGRTNNSSMRGKAYVHYIPF